MYSQDGAVVVHEARHELRHQMRIQEAGREKLIIAKQAEELRLEVVAEKQVSADLQAKLDHQNKNIKMLTGTKQLDKILCAGRTESSRMGLGYTGRQSNNTGKFRHYKRFCYKYLNRVNQMWKQRNF
ncbi:hypothetical protein F2Q69_00044815 [Brassica cretica]|uniref:Uncharacterized protein n=1 Tax=Brassica cretica TaxID=69181 RepID=A0A8S9NT65_BRACR|nr:hypothetical protein F2Q69_00044815 [Brassica cretica]